MTTKIIQLKNGLQVLVDSEDYDYLSQFNWKINRNAVVRTKKINGKTMNYKMHREIMQCPEDKVIDHINHDFLDNRRENLRICTQKQNMRNQKIRNDNTSGYKGVFWNKQIKKWQGKINVNGLQIHLGVFNNKVDAAIAYDNAAKHYFGEFAYLNFPTASVDDAAKDLSLSKTTINRYKPAGESSED